VRLNQAVAGAAASLAAAGVQVLHATGAGHEVEPERPAGAPPYVAVPYIERMDLAYAAADAAISRAGANTVTELAVVGLPAVFVPYPVGNGEQRFNAQPVVDAGGGLLVDDADLTPAWVGEHVVGLVTDAGRLAAMAKVAHDLVPADADDRLAAMVRSVATSTQGDAGKARGNPGKDGL
ncbi:MAG: UDP-N-acetylglucosamine--N-acetylmuramyl-(pentapeptide) pyrophosphoryl-undecaprenol N-acetylglucosamine transferase, partial [Actinopolymorphaceae bacterium]|jgi:UDP-N-acetylglucosamine--N-acetylmuramyl-(pentapeptide) pyrophosphoryl-undecaprenol N-acetylglucosamine transferase